jgi:hypothetical protein
MIKKYYEKNIFDTYGHCIVHCHPATLPLPHLGQYCSDSLQSKTTATPSHSHTQPPLPLPQPLPLPLPQPHCHCHSPTATQCTKLYVSPLIQLQFTPFKNPCHSQPQPLPLPLSLPLPLPLPQPQPHSHTAPLPPCHCHPPLPPSASSRPKSGGDSVYL